MARLIRLGLLTAFAFAVSAATAHAGPFIVAEFRWDVFTDPPIECPPEDAGCEPADAFTQSLFSLTNLWDGPGDLTLDQNTVTLPPDTLPTDTLTLNDLNLFDSDQQLVVGIPDFAAIGVSFHFDGQIVSLAPSALLAPGSLVLTFDPTSVPEPGTFGLLAIGFGFLVRRARRG